MKTLLISMLAVVIGFIMGQSFNGNDQDHLSTNPVNASQPRTLFEESAYPRIKIAPEMVHNLAIRTAPVVKGDLLRNIDALGKITRIDPMARRTLTPPIRGELVFIADKREGEFVKQGELLFSVASEKLFELQELFQAAHSSEELTTAETLLAQLRRMGLRQEQIAALQDGDSPELPVEVYADEDGFIFTRRGIVGESVHKGFTVFNIGGQYRVVEVTAEIFERQWAWVEKGQSALMTVRNMPGKVFEGEVVRVEPPVGYTTRSLEVALKFKTDDPGLSQSMFSNVSIQGKPKEEVLLVPRDTVIYVGHEQRVVLAHDDGSFQPVVVVAGEEAGDMVEILTGLKEHNTVVTSGQFLIDSESNLMTDLLRMTTPDNIDSNNLTSHHHHH